MIWIYFDPDLHLGPFYWLGAAKDGTLDLGDRITLHTRRNKEGKRAPRPNSRVLARSRFTRVEKIDDVVSELFAL